MRELSNVKMEEKCKIEPAFAKAMAGEECKM